MTVPHHSLAKRSAQRWNPISRGAIRLGRRGLQVGVVLAGLVTSAWAVDKAATTAATPAVVLSEATGGITLADVGQPDVVIPLWAPA